MEFWLEYGYFATADKQWNIGVSYRSNLNANLKGHISTSIPGFTFPAGALGPSAPAVSFPAFSGSAKASAKAYMPHTVYLSTSYAVNPCWTIYGSAVWTNWKTTKNLTIKSGLIVPAKVLPPQLGGATVIPASAVTDVINQKWKDVWFFSAGANYKINDTWAVRTGVGYDQSPTKDSTRIPALPDSNKWWLGLGATYTVGKWATTVTYGHEFFEKAKINLQNNPKFTQSTLVGKVTKSIDLVSIQINYRF